MKFNRAPNISCCLLLEYHQQIDDSVYSGPPLIRPLLGNGKPGLIKGVASREGYIRYNYTRFFSKVVAL